MRFVFLALLCFLPIGSDGAGSPAAPPKRPVEIGDAALPSAEQFEKLANTNPIECLKAALRRWHADCHGFTAIMQKHERLGNRMCAPESVDVWFRDKPHSVLLAWRGKPAGLAEKVLYVEGANDNQLLVRPYGELARRFAGDVVTRDPEGKDAKGGGRVSVRDFGFRKATERQLLTWEALLSEGRLQVEYLGVREMPETGRRCHIFRRTCDPPEGPERIGTVEIGLDAEMWLQTYSRFQDCEGNLLGAYSYKDVKVNPEFKSGQFCREVLGQ